MSSEYLSQTTFVAVTFFPFNTLRNKLPISFPNSFIGSRKVTLSSSSPSAEKCYSAIVSSLTIFFIKAIPVMFPFGKICSGIMISS